MKNLQKGLVEILGGTAGQKMQDDLGVAGGLKNGSLGFQFVAKAHAVDEVPIVG
jgi:hypothetical protein